MIISEAKLDWVGETFFVGDPFPEDMQSCSIRQVGKYLSGYLVRNQNSDIDRSDELE